MFSFSKGITLVALTALAAFVFAGGGGSKPTPLNFPEDSVQPVSQPVQGNALVSVDRLGENSTTQYSLQTQTEADPPTYGLSIGTCVIILSFSACMGIAYVVKERLFPYYR